MGGCVTKNPVKVVPKSSENHVKGSRTLKKDNSQSSFVQKTSKNTEIVDSSEVNEQAKLINATPIIIVPNSDEKSNEASRSKPTTNNFSEKQVLSSTVNTDEFTKEYTSTLKPPVAFDVQFHGNHRQPTAPRIYPRRLKKLEGAPCLTTEMLKQKQEMAEKNRCKELQRKAETTSKHRRDVFKAQEFGKLKDAEMQMYTKLLATEVNRQNHMNKIVTKQKEREVRARRVRDKAFLNNIEDENIVHVDETYNSESSCEDLTWGDDIRRNSQESCVQSPEDTDSLDKFFDGDLHSSANHL